MAALFLLAIVVQYNDPDPLRWMLMYAAAFVMSLLALVRGSAPMAPALALGVIALVWVLYWATNVTTLATYGHMFDSWEMKSVPVEEARETSGLLIVVAWMVVLAGNAYLQTKRTARTSRP